MKSEILKSVEDYYADKIRKHGPSAQGVDWRSSESQELRFDKLLQAVPKSRFSLLDYGCGYGALLNYLNKSGYADFQYTGLDISEEMLCAARKAYKDSGLFIDSVGDTVYDFTVASGIFNVKLQHDENAWEEYILATLDELNRVSRSGFSFNMLTSYSDKEYMRDDLYYGSPEKFFTLCKRKYSMHVTLLHDYPLYEFTIIVRK